MRNTRAQRTEDQIKKDSTNVRVNMARLRQAASEFIPASNIRV
jgi:hypothetical protein